MQFRLLIFVFSGVLLVPFIYAVSYIPEVCAVPPDPNWGKTGYCSKLYDGKQTCCWKEPDILNPGEDIWWCQDCESNPQGGAKDCGPLYLKPSSDTTDLPQGGVLQEPAGPTGKPQDGPLGGGILQDLGPKLSEKGGIIQGQNMTFSQANITSSNDSRAPTLQQLEQEAETTENETTVEGEEQEQDESGESGNSNEEEE